MIPFVRGNTVPVFQSTSLHYVFNLANRKKSVMEIDLTTSFEQKKSPKMLNGDCHGMKF